MAALRSASLLPVPPARGCEGGFWGAAGVAAVLAPVAGVLGVAVDAGAAAGAGAGAVSAIDISKAMRICSSSVISSKLRAAGFAAAALAPPIRNNKHKFSNYTHTIMHTWEHARTHKKHTT